MSDSSSSSSSSSSESPSSPAISSAAVDSSTRCLTAIQSLASIVTTTTVPSSLPLLLHDSSVSAEISSLLRRHDSGAGDNNLCRWLYDTFQSCDPSLQLFVLRFIPLISGLYLSRVPLRRNQAGFEAVLLALYAHETTSRAGVSVTVNIPDLSHPSVYHESMGSNKNNSTTLNIAVLSPALEPHGTVRSTRRARIVGVALELFFSEIARMPRESKLDFCEFCEIWAGQSGQSEEDESQSQPITTTTTTGTNANLRPERDDGTRIPLPWELLQPVLRILGHCLMGLKVEEREVSEAANKACQSLYLRSLHDLNPKAILAAGSLLRLREMVLDPKNQTDFTEISNDAVISV